MAGFSANPFKLENASLRAGMSDRDEVARILSDAYAEGKLDDLEYQERLESALRIKLLGEVRPLVIDLGSPKHLLARREPPAMAIERIRAEKRSELRRAITTWSGLAVLFNVIYLVTALTGAGLHYYWPIWPLVGVGIWVVTALADARRPVTAKELERPNED